MKMYTNKDYMKKNMHKTTIELGSELGVNRSVIGKWRKKFGLTRDISKDELYKNFGFMKNNIHKSNRELAEELNCTHSTISSWRKKLKLNKSSDKLDNGQHTFKNKEWLEKACYEIGVQEHIAKMCNVSGDTISYWIKKHNLILGEQWRDVNRTHTVNHCYFEIINTEEKAYWLGFIEADGCVARTNKNGKYDRLHINLKYSDREHLVKLKNALSSNYPIKKVERYDNRGFYYELASLRIASEKLVSHIINSGIVPAKTGKEEMPKLDDNLIKHFIRGFLDGDGSITMKKTSRMCSASEKILIQIKKHLESKLGITCNITIADNTKEVPVYILDYSTSKSKILLDYLYKDSIVYLDRKYNRYQNLFCSPM